MELTKCNTATTFLTVRVLFFIAALSITSLNHRPRGRNHNPASKRGSTSTGAYYWSRKRNSLSFFFHVIIKMADLIFLFANTI